MHDGGGRVTPLVLIRHGPTAWNAEGRIQGHSDQPLSDAGRRAVAAWRLPADLAGPAVNDWRAVVSPLRRARETAALLWPALPANAWETAPTLIEMSWGDWEGRRLADLRREGGAAVAEGEARGLDFRPPGGESPRGVQARLRPFLAGLAQDGRASVAVTHKGVIRAIYALASGWDMRDKPPIRLIDACLHRFRLDASGCPEIDRLNVPLAP